MAHWVVITNIILNEKSKGQRCIYFITLCYENISIGLEENL